LVTSNAVRQYEHPRSFENLAKFRRDVIPIEIVHKHRDIGRDVETKVGHAESI